MPVMERATIIANAIVSSLDILLLIDLFRISGIPYEYIYIREYTASPSINETNISYIYKSVIKEHVIPLIEVIKNPIIETLKILLWYFDINDDIKFIKKRVIIYLRA
jgi:hypothetical protein